MCYGLGVRMALNPSDRLACRYAETLVAVGKRLVLAGTPVATPFIPIDELVTDGNHCHFHFCTFPLLARYTLGFGQHLLADAAALQRRLHRKHAEVAGCTLLLFEMRAREQLARTRAEQNAAVGSRDDFTDADRIGALPVEQI